MYKKKTKKNKGPYLEGNLNLTRGRSEWTQLLKTEESINMNQFMGSHKDRNLKNQVKPPIRYIKFLLKPTNWLSFKTKQIGEKVIKSLFTIIEILSCVTHNR